MNGKWIKLEEQSREFAFDKSKAVQGNLKIINGKVVFDGQNLMPGNGYKLIFIGRKKGNSVYKILGDIVPDQNGNVIFQQIVNPADIDGEGTDLSCFYIFMIAVMGRPVRTVLKGDLLDSGKSPERTGSKKVQHSNQRYNDYYKDFIMQKMSVLVEGAGNYTRISPFDDAWLVDNWRRTADITLLPIASVGAEMQIRKYGHFIFGFTEKHFYLGVPGRHTDEEWPDRGESGFLLWQSIKKSAEYGYWAMVIDRKTGIITEIS